MTHDISRRSLAKGAAWAAPAVAATAAVPAYAASSSAVTITCPAAAQINIQAGGQPNIFALTASSVYSGGTMINLGGITWNFPERTASDGTKITGYYMLPGSCGYTTCAPDTAGGPTLPGPADATVTTVDGKTYSGKIGAYTPTGCSPQVAGAGLAITWYLHTDMPYNINVWDSCQLGTPQTHIDIASITIPVTIIYLNGLTPVLNSAGGSCCYNLTMEFPTGKGVCLGTKEAADSYWTNL